MKYKDGSSKDQTAEFQDFEAFKAAASRAVETGCHIDFTQAPKDQSEANKQIDAFKASDDKYKNLEITYDANSNKFKYNNSKWI